MPTRFLTRLHRFICGLPVGKRHGDIVVLATYLETHHYEWEVRTHPQPHAYLFSLTQTYGKWRCTRCGAMGVGLVQRRVFIPPHCTHS